MPTLHHVEAGMAGRHLHRHLGPLLLLGDLLEADGDAGQFLELLHVRLRHVAARRKLVVDLDVLALALLPVELRLRVGARHDRGRGENGGGRLK